PPRQVRPGVPRALAAICAKAMALEPGERYPTALALAADVERWLADEPVGAYRDPPLVRAGRWARKHRTAVTAATAAVVVARAAAGWAGYEARQRGLVRQAQAQGRDREAEGLLGEIEGLRAAAKQMEPALAKLQLTQALARAERAATLLGEGGADAELD